MNEPSADGQTDGYAVNGTVKQRERETGSSYPGRQSPQRASEVAVPGFATFLPRILQEVCGRQSSELNESEKAPVGHDRHCTSSAGLWICPQGWQDGKHL